MGVFFLALLLLGGCSTTQPASKAHYQRPVPLLERQETPSLRVRPAEPDMRLISTYRPAGQAHALRPGFHHPAGASRVREIFFQDVPLEIAAEMLNDLSGVNLMLQGATAGKNVRLYLRDVPLAKAVESLLRGNGLWFRTDGLVTAVMSEEAFADKMIFRESEKIQAFFMRYTNAQDMAALMATVLGPDVEFRDMTGQSVYGHLESRAVGGTAETTSSRADLSEEERRRLVQLGADHVSQMEEATRVLGRRVPAIITVFKKNNAIVVRSTDEGLLRHLTGLVRELDTPVRQVLLEVRILRLQLGDTFQSFFDFEYAGGTSVRTALSTMGGVAPLTSDTLGFVFSTDEIEGRLQLFAEENQLETLSSPFLMTADNAEVRFFVGEQVPLRTGVSKETVRGEGLQDLVIFIPEVDNVELGTDLEIKSFINADRTITMEIVAKIESANFEVSSITLVNDRTGQPINFPLDGVNKNELRSILSVPSSHTVALGGFIRQESRDSEQKIPFLGDIPAVGYLFKKVDRQASRSETVILITPHVVGHPGEGFDQTQRFLEKGSRLPERWEEGAGEAGAPGEPWDQPCPGDWLEP